MTRFGLTVLGALAIAIGIATSACSGTPGSGQHAASAPKAVLPDIAKMGPVTLTEWDQQEEILGDLNKEFEKKYPNVHIVRVSKSFTNIMTSDFLPNFKKLGVTDYWAYTTTFGGPQGEVTLVRPLSKLAEIDQGPLLTQAVGAEQAAPINARRAALMISSEITFERYIPELSFGMPARATN